jgi:hypothetical protein
MATIMRKSTGTPTSAACTKLFSLALGVVALASALFLGCEGKVAVVPAHAAAELARLNAACVEAMVKSTCQVMTGPAAADSASVVFIAGLGPVDAKAYRELRASGEAMCATVRDACRSNWAGPQCTTARALWPAINQPG